MNIDSLPNVFPILILKYENLNENIILPNAHSNTIFNTSSCNYYYPHMFCSQCQWL